MRAVTRSSVAVVTQEQSLFPRLASSAFRRKLVRGLKRFVGYREGASCAKVVATFGERVEDIFYITDAQDRPVEDPLKLECLRYSITTALAQP
jgi:hypothetical protein